MINNSLKYINIVKIFIPLYQIILLNIKPMETRCVNCTKNTASENPRVIRTKHSRLMFASTCAGCSKENQRSLETKKLLD